MKTKLFTLAIAALAICLLGSCKKDNDPKTPKQLPEGALSGEFTVNAEGKKVHFSKGNLVATIDATGAPTAWKFATNQYDYIGEGGANKTIGIAAGDVDLFGWSTDTALNNWGIHTKKWTVEGFPTDFITGNFKDWGIAYCTSNGIAEGTWRTLTIAEWQYLLETRKVIDRTGYHPRYTRITYSGKLGYVLYPDGYEGQILNSNTQYTDENFPKDCVFIPFAGDRGGFNVYDAGVDGEYWSSTAKDSNHAYMTYFGQGDVHPDFGIGRDSSCSVRLVTDVK